MYKVPDNVLLWALSSLLVLECICRYSCSISHAPPRKSTMSPYILGSSMEGVNCRSYPDEVPKYSYRRDCSGTSAKCLHAANVCVPSGSSHQTNQLSSRQFEDTRPRSQRAVLRSNLSGRLRKKGCCFYLYRGSVIKKQVRTRNRTEDAQ